MPAVLPLLLRFERATASDQAYVAPDGPVDYLIGGEDDLFNAQLDWTPGLVADLLAVGQPGALEASRRVGQRPRAMPAEQTTACIPPEERLALTGERGEGCL